MSCIKLRGGLHLQDFGNTGASLSVITETMPQIYAIHVISATKQIFLFHPLLTSLPIIHVLINFVAPMLVPASPLQMTIFQHVCRLISVAAIFIFQCWIGISIMAATQ